MFSLKIYKVIILCLCLASCQAKTAKTPKITLPSFPVLSKQASDEVKGVCVPRKKCDNLNTYLNELYVFSLKYNIYREELGK